MKTYTFKEVAKELGIGETELTAFAQKEGLIDEKGMPTKFAIDNDLLEINDDFTIE